MTLPDKTLFSTAEVCDLLSLSQSSVRRLIAEGQLSKVYPRPRAMRITRESLSAHLTRAAQPGAVAESSRAGQLAQAEAKVRARTETKAKKRGGLLSRWGIGG